MGKFKLFLFPWSTVTMENGHQSVMITVSGTKRGQYLHAHNWVTVKALVS